MHHFKSITALLMAAALPALALDPISPPGGRQGTDVTVTLTDDNISSFQELITYQPGLSLTGLKLDGKNEKRATATLHIAPDAALGEHSLRIRTAHDISYLRSFWVGPFPSISEIEPNNTSAEAQPVELNTTVDGIVTTEEVDIFVVSLKKGQRLSVEAEAMRLGRVLFDAYLTILDPENSELASCDDTPFLKTEPYLSIIAPRDGDYRILIREAAFEGSDQSAYRLHIGTFPRPTALYPPGGKPGETLDISFIGDPSGNFTRTVTLPPAPDQKFHIFPSLGGETSPSPLPVVVSPLEHSSQTGGNTNPKNAHPFPTIPSAVDGILDRGQNNRWFSFKATKGQNLDIGVIARSLRSPLDPVLSIRDEKNKNLVANDDDQGSLDSFIKWTCPENGTYYLILRDQLARTGPDFVFRIEINERKPSISASLPTTEPNNSQKDKYFPVPRGNRYAALIRLQRENIACGIQFIAENLPPGIRMTVPDIPESLNSFPVLFEASEDAPLSSQLTTFTIRATGEKAPENLSSPLTDTVDHIEVNNEGVYHSHQADRITTAVIEPAPFAIELDQPTVPIVRDGKLLLKVRAIRHGDFKEKITTRLLWSPPGISGPANVDLAPEKNELEYEINANSDAATGSWQICVIAEADTPTGRKTVSSNFVSIEVAEPFVKLTLDLGAGKIGTPSALVAKIDQLREFQGNATAQLLSLPHGVTSETVQFSKEQTEITFPLQISKDAKPGKNTGILCRVLIPEKNGHILHLTGKNGTLRIDPAPKNKAQPSSEKPANTDQKTADKPLSRLEQLRQRK